MMMHCWRVSRAYGRPVAAVLPHCEAFCEVSDIWRIF